MNYNLRFNGCIDLILSICIFGADHCVLLIDPSPTIRIKWLWEVSNLSLKADLVNTILACLQNERWRSLFLFSIPEIITIYIWGSISLCLGWKASARQHLSNVHLASGHGTIYSYFTALESWRRYVFGGVSEFTNPNTFENHSWRYLSFDVSASSEAACHLSILTQQSFSS